MYREAIEGEASTLAIITEIKKKSLKKILLVYIIKENYIY